MVRRLQLVEVVIAQALAALVGSRRWHQQGDGDPGDTGGLLLAPVLPPRWRLHHFDPLPDRR